MANSHPRFYNFGSFRLMTAERKLFHRGEYVPLTAKVFDLLLFLVGNSHRVLTKDELMKTIWPDAVVEENNLSVNISALRKALHHSDDNSEYIETLPKQGYRFIAQVKEAQPQRKGGNSLAVLPLINASADPGAEYLSDGITESIINSLAQLPQLRVMAYSVMLRYEHLGLDSQQVGRELGVRYALAGKILMLGNKLIIRTELVDVGSGRQIWGEQYTHSTAHLLAAQQEISEAVSEQLQLKLTGKQKRSLAKRQTENKEAYHAYLKGRYFQGKRTIEGINTGLEFFHLAIEIDAKYALAYVGIADCYNLLMSYGTLSPTDSFPKVKEVIRKALKINSNLAEAHASLGLARSYERDWEGAEKEFKRAIKINEDYPSTHQWYASYLKIMGRFDEAFREIRYALRLDPLSLTINQSLAAMHYCARQYDHAIAQANETLKLDANFVPALTILGIAHAQKGTYGEAIIALKKQAALAPTPEALALLGHTYAIAGKKKEAQRVLKELHELSQRRYVESAYMAVIYAGLNERDAAFEWLEKAYEERNEFLLLLAVHPVLDNLRADSRFRDLLHRLGLSHDPR
ncbi:MAG: winged helix-turn-helix domain-containing protein [Pyrinomonadaceae bacterium]